MAKSKEEVGALMEWARGRVSGVAKSGEPGQPVINVEVIVPPPQEVEIIHHWDGNRIVRSTITRKRP